MKGNGKMLKIYGHIMEKTNLLYAYKMIKENILRLDLKPGVEIKDTELQIDLKMSRTPVREAILLLKHDGLIENRKAKITNVKKIDLDKIREGCFVRDFLEKEILRDACKYFTEEDLKGLKNTLEQYEYIMQTTRDRDEMYNLEREFHKRIFIGSNHMELFDVVYLGFFDFWRVRELNRRVNSRQILEGHKKIYDIIRKNTTEEIDEVIEEYFFVLDNDIDKVVEQYPMYFENDMLD